MKQLSNYLTRLLLSIILVLSFSAVKAQLQPSAIFKSGVVLQQGVQVPVWGKAVANDTVTVQINGQTIKSVVSESGVWEVNLASMESGGPFQMAISTSSNEDLTLSDVYVGDVWLAAGQSNMEWTLNNDDNGSSEITAANDPLIREFKISKGLSKELSNELPSSTWKGATSANAGSFSAVAYYFAKELKESINVPVGIVNASYGGARIEAFMSEEALGFDEDFVVLQPQSYYAERQPTMIFNKMINPILKFPIKGVIWYQGESNADGIEDAKAYGNLFKTMINSWRASWGLGDLPFLWVQLPNQGTAYAESSPQTWDAWPQVRAGQTRALSLPNTGEAVTIDVGQVDIHPTNKKPVGERLALVARQVAYGEDILASGPRYKSHMVSGNTVTITFDFVGSGLTGLSGDAVKWFSIAGSNGVLMKADAVITGTNTVEVSNVNITSPEIIRYAWEYNPVGVDLYNSENLPAAPFYIYVNPKPYELASFTISKTNIERGESIDLEWKTFGASSVTLNGIEVDSSASMRLYPRDTTVYTLKTINRLNPIEMDSMVLIVNVTDPQPTVSISSSEGSTLAPASATKIIADANAPGGGTITQVEFFVNGVSTFTDTEAPFEMDWSSDTLGDFSIEAEVTDGNGYKATSNTYSILVTNLKVLLYEAEDALLTGSTGITSLANASGGKLVSVQQSWVITFNNVSAPEDGTYPLTIGYQLTFEGPKTQSLYVNGVKQSVVFEAPDNATLMQLKVDVVLKAGSNQIRLEPDWAWMSFDFISLSVDADAIIPPSITVKTDVGETTGPGAEIMLIADVKAPGAAVTNVEFFVDGESVGFDTQAPYELAWTPDTIKEYSITAKVTDEANSMVSSEPFILNSTNIRFITIEAEDAVFTGAATVQTATGASAGKYVKTEDVWSLKFSDISVPTAGVYDITIGYQLVESPKTQKMFVNGVSQSVIFNAAVELWAKLRLQVTLKAGLNEIRFEPDWAWMNFDYLTIAIPEPEVGLDNDLSRSNGLVLYDNFPNPFNEYVNVSFELPKGSEVNVELINTKGLMVLSKYVGSLSEGKHQINIETIGLESGIYVVKLTSKETVVSKKVILSK